MGTIAILAGLVAFLLVVLAGVLWIEHRDVRKLRDRFSVQIQNSHQLLAVKCAELDAADKEIARLNGELSKAQNTLGLAAVEEQAQRAGKKEPIKAKTASEVRLAVEKNNLLELEKKDE